MRYNHVDISHTYHLDHHAPIKIAIENVEGVQVATASTSDRGTGRWNGWIRPCNRLDIYNNSDDGREKHIGPTTEGRRIYSFYINNVDNPELRDFVEALGLYFRHRAALIVLDAHRRIAKDIAKNAKSSSFLYEESRPKQEEQDEEEEEEYIYEEELSEYEKKEASRNKPIATTVNSLRRLVKSTLRDKEIEAIDNMFHYGYENQLFIVVYGGGLRVVL